MTPPTQVAIVRTGAANLASVIAAFDRLGSVTPVVTDDPHLIHQAPFAVLPGVGAFGPAMARLREQGLVAPLRQRVDADKPTLAICLGLQLLAPESEESPHTTGLAIIQTPATRFQGPVRVPHIGWNRVEPEPGFTASPPGYAYFANSYRLTACPPGWSAAWSHHAGPFIAAIQRGRVLACQFHPELSGRFGHELLRSWLDLPPREPTPC